MNEEATININGEPFVYTALPINGPTTFPIDNTACLDPMIVPLFRLLVYVAISFCSNGAIKDLSII